MDLGFRALRVPLRGPLRVFEGFSEGPAEGLRLRAT